MPTLETLPQNAPVSPARRVNLQSLIRGEHDENELREDFRPSERVAIGLALEEDVGERRGRDNVQNFAQYEGEKTRDIAAKRSGFWTRSVVVVVIHAPSNGTIVPLADLSPPLRSPIQ